MCHAVLCQIHLYTWHRLGTTFPNIDNALRNLYGERWRGNVFKILTKGDTDENRKEAGSRRHGNGGSNPENNAGGRAEI